MRKRKVKPEEFILIFTFYYFFFPLQQAHSGASWALEIYYTTSIICDANATLSSASPLSEARLLLIISRHHSGAAVVATHGQLRLLLLVLLLWRTEAIHVELLLLVGMKVIAVRLVDIHVLLNELLRCCGRRWRRLHHLTLANILAIHAHATVAHDLTARSSKLRGLRHRRRLLVNEVLLKPIVLIALPHHELSGLTLHGELRYRLIAVLVFVVVVGLLAHFRFNCFREGGRETETSMLDNHVNEVVVATLNLLLNYCRHQTVPLRSRNSCPESFQRISF